MSKPTAKLMQKLSALLHQASPEDGSSFDEHFKGILQHMASATTVNYLTGLPEINVLNALSDSLEHVSQTSDNSELASQMWNPLIAAVFNSYRSIISTLDGYSLSENTKKKLMQPKIVTQPKRSLKKEKQTTVATAPPPVKSKRKRKKQKVSVPIPMLEEIIVEPTSAPPPVSPTPSEVVDCETRHQILDDVSHCLDTTTTYIFGGQQASIKCKAKACTICRKIALRMPLSKCSEIRKHATRPCHASGWYPHTTAFVAQKMSKIHKDPSLLENFVCPPMDFKDQIERPNTPPIPVDVYVTPNFVPKRKSVAASPWRYSKFSKTDETSATSSSDEVLDPKTPWDTLVDSDE